MKNTEMKHKMATVALIGLTVISTGSAIKSNDNLSKLELSLKAKTENYNKLENKFDKLDTSYSNLTSDYDLVRDELYSLQELNNKLTYFNPDNLNVPSNVSADTLGAVLEGTGMSGLEYSIVEAEKKYGINAFALASIIAQESSWGDSPRARATNNLSGYAVYTNASRGRVYSSRSESVLDTAKLLANDYVTKGGKYYKGVGITDVNTNYCQVNNKPDYDWSKSIRKIGKDLNRKANVLMLY